MCYMQCKANALCPFCPWLLDNNRLSGLHSAAANKILAVQIATVNHNRSSSSVVTGSSRNMQIIALPNRIYTT